ncbi:synaptonemal complex central element protein 2 isoform X1 [Brachionichthys hirsutus]|uniref:synaptonemal complex central element protein 2 isoform X1 n=1 Tax=Brachionichthys hirsutus TaxID=412623 RepID=UPI003604FBEB
MESFYEDQASTVESPPEGIPEESALTEDMDHNSTKLIPSSEIEIQEQSVRYRTTQSPTRSPIVTHGYPGGVSLVSDTACVSSMHRTSSITGISRKMETLIERVNSNRSSDMIMIESFQEQMIEKVVEMCQLMKSHMCATYEANSMEMQPKLQELSEVLENCTKLGNELLEVNQELVGLREACLPNGETAGPK